MTERTKTLDIAHYSGWETVIYDHEGKGDKVEDYKSGDTVIAKADKGSGVILSTDVSGITMTDKNAVEATLKALAQKVTYKDHAANGENLSGKVQIAEGLTSSSVSKNLGTIHWDENGKGQYDLDSVNWNKIIEGDYETFVMKGVRSAATTSLHTWRDNMQDTYTGADMAMVGRGAFGDPWIFPRAIAAIEGREIPPRPPLAERCRVAQRQFRLAAEQKGEKIACLEARKHYAWYLRGVAHSVQWKKEISQISTMADIDRITEGICRELV